VTLRQRIIAAFIFSVLLTAGLGGSLLVGIRQGKKVSEEMSRADRLHQLIQETNYFLHRHTRVLMYFVMFREDADRMQIYQVQDSLTEKLDAWKKLIDGDRNRAMDLAAVKNLCERISFLRFQIIALIDDGDRTIAITRMREDFLPVAAEAEKTMKRIDARMEAESKNRMGMLASVVKRSQTIFILGSLLSVFLVMAVILGIRQSIEMTLGGRRPLSRFRAPVPPPPFKNVRR
jgi:predicted O-linked N-acetylglucosamine transferase (SPINDLY family)